MMELPFLGTVISLLWTVFLAALGCAIAIWAARQSHRQSDVVAHLTRRPAFTPPVEPPVAAELIGSKKEEDR